MNIINEIMEEIYSNVSPYTNIDLQIDLNYPHTNLKIEVLESIFKNCSNDGFYLEFGSMLGGSAIMAANFIKSNNINNQIICIEPFCGDVNMWCWEKDLLKNNKWKFLNLKDGKPTIYNRFLSNVVYTQNDKHILPIQCTSLIGVDLIKRLFLEKRIKSLPNFIYLDSAHLEEETFLELKKCYSLLNNGGILFGDDWNWQSVRNDVISFSSNIAIDLQKTINISNKLKNSYIYENKIIIYENQWIICK